MTKYNNKDVASTLEALDKMITFYHNKVIEMLHSTAHYQI